MDGRGGEESEQIALVRKASIAVGVWGSGACTARMVEGLSPAVRPDAIRGIEDADLPEEHRLRCMRDPPGSGV